MGFHNVSFYEDIYSYLLLITQLIRPLDVPPVWFSPQRVALCMGRDVDEKNLHMVKFYHY